MSAESMARFRCWSSEDVATTVFSDIGGLPVNSDALFLAAHTPVALQHLKGAEESANDQSEREVLEAVTRWIGVRATENTLVAVTGGSGTGKSHVVRWVHANLPVNDPRFHVLYVPRAIQTLRDLLRRIIEGLPGVEGRELLDRVDAAVANVKPGELQDRLLSEMKIALDWTLEERGPQDGETEEEAAARVDRNNMLGFVDPETGGRRDGLSQILEIPQVRDQLARPEGRLSQLVQSYFDASSRRGDGEETFTVADLPLKDRGVYTTLAARRELKELWRLITSQPGDALELLEEALRVALPQVTGLRSATGETLDSLFVASRKALKARGQELVLLFEDLSQFGLVDADLYNQFATQPGEDMAPLRVVFAITDGAYARMERTVTTRVKDRFQVGTGVLADPQQFVARYLNLVRVGKAGTLAAWDEAGGQQCDSTWMVNACDTREEGLPCRVRETCHGAFGAVEVAGLGTVGLYPYNSEALGRALVEVEDYTPRGVMDQCITTNLLEADRHIAEGDYPHERVEKLFDFTARQARPVLLEEFPSSDPARSYRALVIWGNESALPVGLLEAFSLDETLANPKDDSNRQAPPSLPLPKETPPLENRLGPLFQWQNGMNLPEDMADEIRDCLRRFTFDRLQLDTYLIHVHSGRGKTLLDRLFNRTSFVIEGARGAGAGENSVRFSLTRSDADVLVMAAALWFRDHGHFDPRKALWQWPGGSDPAPLLVAFESRLDAWAEEVRARFLQVTGGAKLARFALGTRAIALCAAGMSVDQVISLPATAQSPVVRAAPPDEVWTPVNNIATAVSESLKVPEYVAEFAGVRQGVNGQAQLVDVFMFDDVVSAFIEHPLESLQRVVSESPDPSLIQYADQLLKAVENAAPGEHLRASEAIEAVRSTLQGCNPSRVAVAAKEIGGRAREEGFFRPYEDWEPYQQAIEVLSAAEFDGLIAIGDDVRDLIRSQGVIRQIHRLERSLMVVKRVMEATTAECERSSASGANVPALREAVQRQLDQLAHLVGELRGD